MRVDDALSQIEAIHDHLTKTEVYRGVQVSSVAAAGLLGLAAAAAQPWIPGTEDPFGFLQYWVIVAVVCGLFPGSSGLYAYLYQEDEYEQRATRRLVGQFFPCLMAGIVVTVALMRENPELIHLLPGLWALLFGLGLLAARPYLPRAIGWVSFKFNTGRLAGTGLLAKVNAKAFADVPGEFMKWINAKGKPVTGLKNRRQGEVALWSKP